MLSIRFLAISLLFSSTSFAQCVHCTSLDEALINPEKVISLDLRAQGFATIPKELNELVNLESLDLSVNLIQKLNNNDLFLPALTSLVLTNNPGIDLFDLEGVGASFPSLIDLNLSENSVRHVSKYLSELSKLESLNLSRNAIEFIPDEIGEITTLKNIDVSYNDLSDPFWMRNLWNIETVHVQGNSKLKSAEIAMSLFEKSEIVRVEINAKATKGISELWRLIPMSELILSGSSISSMNFKVCRNDSIKKIIFKNCSIQSSAKVFNWLNRFKQLESVEFLNMAVPKDIDFITEVDHIYFNNCEFDNKYDLRDIKPQVQVHAENCDIASGDFIGNTQRARTVSVLNPMVDNEMVSNLLEPIIEPVTESIEVTSTESSTIALEFSRYSIPENAFLTESGEVYEGQVEVRIKEYNNPIENALAGVPMTYRNDGRNETFASSGMIDFRAYDEEGNQLKANPNQVIQVELDDVQPNVNTDLYVFNEDSSNWEVIGRPSASSFDSLKKYYMDSLNKVPDSLIAVFRVIPIRLFMNYKKYRNSPNEISFSSIGQGRYDKNWFKKQSTIVHTSNSDQRFLAGKIWKIDTIVTEEMGEMLMDIAGAQKSHKDFWKRTKIRRKSTGIFPSPISDLRIKPNLDHDNYTMTFNYKGRKVRIPVISSFGGKISKVQRREAANYKSYKKYLKSEGKELELIEKHKDKFFELRAESVRENMANFLARNREFMADQREVLRFGLNTFGLVNCDYFSRNKPDTYLAYTKEAIDQHGQRVHIPENVRNILLSDNSYVSTSSARVPVYMRDGTIVLFAVGDNELAVVKEIGKKVGSRVQPNVVRFSIEGLSGGEIIKKVMDI